MKTINKIILVLVMVGMAQTVSAQSYHIEYDYDDAGNRITRDRLEIIPKKIEAEKPLEDVKIAVIYPNPTKGEFKIEVSLEEKEVAKASLYDNNGRLIKAINIQSNTTNIDISSFANGAYFLKVICKEDTYEWKIIKKS